MEIKTLIEDEDAVSPVIGVILMVAITVILAAVIGTFVLGLGDQVSNTAPSASFTFDYTSGTTNGDCGGTALGSDGTLAITHDGGDKIQGDQLYIGDDDGNKYSWNTAGDADGDCSIGTEVTAGDTGNVEVGSEDTVRVTWEASGGGDTATLGKWTGPDA